MTKIYKNIEANVEADASVKARRVCIEHKNGNGVEVWFYDDGRVALQSIISQGHLWVRKELVAP